MEDICTRITHIQRGIGAAATASGRKADEVRLIAVSKGQSAERIEAAWRCGQRAFGENYLQEALPKIARLSSLGIEWHFLGPIQANKTKAIAEQFAWVHSVDRLRIAERLNQQRPATLPPLQVCIQVNISGEDTKSGVEPGAVMELAQAVAGLPALRLRGLMAIGAPGLTEADQRGDFSCLRALRDGLNQHGLMCDTLSMGMSDDFPAAIAEGATLVRIGTAVFGLRARKANH